MLLKLQNNCQKFKNVKNLKLNEPIKFKENKTIKSYFKNEDSFTIGSPITCEKTIVTTFFFKMKYILCKVLYAMLNKILFFN